MKPRNIGVLMGGISTEREISLCSGKVIAEALQDLGFNVTCIDVRDTNIEDLDREQLDLVFIALYGYFGMDEDVRNILESKGIPYLVVDIHHNESTFNTH